jgi:hypothetical protein
MHASNPACNPAIADTLPHRFAFTGYSRDLRSPATPQREHSIDADERR